MGFVGLTGNLARQMAVTEECLHGENCLLVSEKICPALLEPLAAQASAPRRQGITVTTVLRPGRVLAILL